MCSLVVEVIWKFISFQVSNGTTTNDAVASSSTTDHQLVTESELAEVVVKLEDIEEVPANIAGIEDAQVKLEEMFNWKEDSGEDGNSYWISIKLFVLKREIKKECWKYWDMLIWNAYIFFSCQLYLNNREINPEIQIQRNHYNCNYTIFQFLQKFVLYSSPRVLNKRQRTYRFLIN